MMHYTFSINDRELKRLNFYARPEGASAYTRKAIMEYLETQDKTNVGVDLKRITAYVDDDLAELILRVSNEINTRPTTLVKEAFQWKLYQ